MADGAATYPATFAFSPPDKVANWRPLLNWLLAIPHFIVLYGLRIVAEVIAVISWFAILFTGAMPDAFANFQSMYLRYGIRVYTFVAFMQEEYPPFTFGTTPADPGDDARVRVDFRPQLTERNRLTVAFRAILVIPQVVVLFFLAVAAFVVGVIAFFAVLFTGRWPEGMRDFVLKVVRWELRLEAYFLMLTDLYPPFELA